MAQEVDKRILDIAESIKEMKIRGAGTIARAAAEALKIAAETFKGKDYREFMNYFDYVADLILKTRPTAVSLPNAIRMIKRPVYKKVCETTDLEEIKGTVVSAVNKFIEESKKAINTIAEIGSRRIKPGNIILTHCHSRTALSVITTAHKKFIKENKEGLRVIATETRPRFQGLITAKSLADEGIPVTLIVDSAVRSFIEEADLVIVGADAIAANGAIVNKIGTSLVALAANEARVRVYVAAETIKFSPETLVGALVEIEERPATEVVDEKFLKKNPLIKVRNPAFDVTPPEYIDLIITEKGVFSPQVAAIILKDELGWSLQEYTKCY